MAILLQIDSGIEVAKNQQNTFILLVKMYCYMKTQPLTPKISIAQIELCIGVKQFHSHWLHYSVAQTVSSISNQSASQLVCQSVVPFSQKMAHKILMKLHLKFWYLKRKKMTATFPRKISFWGKAQKYNKNRVFLEFAKFLVYF